MSRQAYCSSLGTPDMQKRGRSCGGKKVLRLFYCSWLDVSPEWGEAFRKLNLVNNWIGNSLITGSVFNDFNGHLTFGP